MVASLLLLGAGSLARKQPCEPRALSFDMIRTIGIVPEVPSTAPGGPYRDLEFSSMRVQSLDLPSWFGEPSMPRTRITGRIVGAAPDMTVRLALDVPEPGIWPGRVVALHSDGSFDFGPMREGAYRLIAYGGGRVTHWTPVDLTGARTGDVVLVAEPCHRVHGSFWAISAQEAIPAAGVAVDLAGWIVGVTDAHGAYDACVPEASDDAKLRVAGFADSPWADRHGHRLLAR